MSLFLLFTGLGKTSSIPISKFKDITPFIEYEHDTEISINVNLDIEVELIEKIILKKKNMDILLLLDEDLWLLEESK